MGSDGTNYIKFLKTKPNIHTIKDVATKYNVPVYTMQRYAKILNFPKDSSNMYILREEHLQRLEEFLHVINRH